MELSDRDRRVLADLEASLAAQDPALLARFRAVRAPRAGTNQRHLSLAVLAFVVGLVDLIATLQWSPWWALAGVATMYLGGLLGVRTLARGSRRGRDQAREYSAS